MVSVFCVLVEVFCGLRNRCVRCLAAESHRPDDLSQRIEDIYQKSQEVILADDSYFQKEFIRHMTYEYNSTL